MILAELSTDVPKMYAEFAGCVAFTVLAVNESIKFFKNVKGKEPQPANETLGQANKSLSRRVYVLEGSISKIYGLLDKQKDELKKELAEQTQTIVAAGERRQEAINDQFKEIAASLATLNERTREK